MTTFALQIFVSPSPAAKLQDWAVSSVAVHNYTHSCPCIFSASEETDKLDHHSLPPKIMELKKLWEQANVVQLQHPTVQPVRRAQLQSRPAQIGQIDKKSKKSATAAKGNSTCGSTVFSTGHPRQYSLAPAMLVCADRTRRGRFIAVWPQMI